MYNQLTASRFVHVQVCATSNYYRPNSLLNMGPIWWMILWALNRSFQAAKAAILKAIEHRMKSHVFVTAVHNIGYCTCWMLYKCITQSNNRRLAPWNHTNTNLNEDIRHKHLRLIQLLNSVQFVSMLFQIKYICINHFQYNLY